MLLLVLLLPQRAERIVRPAHADEPRS
jgi:hypothetical protein